MKIRTVWGARFLLSLSGLTCAEDSRDTMRESPRETEKHVKEGDEENSEPDSGHADEKNDMETHSVQRPDPVRSRKESDESAFQSRTRIISGCDIGFDGRNAQPFVFSLETVGSYRKDRRKASRNGTGGPASIPGQSCPYGIDMRERGNRLEYAEAQSDERRQGETCLDRKSEKAKQAEVGNNTDHKRKDNLN